MNQSRTTHHRRNGADEETAWWKLVIVRHGTREAVGAERFVGDTEA